MVEEGFVWNTTVQIFITSSLRNASWCFVYDVGCVVYLTLKVLVATIDAQWEGMGDVGSARYEPALVPPCSTIRVLSYSN